MILCDSNILIALFREKEAHHQKAFDFFSAQNKIIITDSILGEIYTVLLMREKYDTAQKALDVFHSHEKIEITQLKKEELKKTITLLSQNKTHLSFIDASLIVIAKERNIPLFSFDKEVMKYADL